MEAFTERAFLPNEACGQLGVSASTLRRMAQFYEQAFGELPKDTRGGRLYPDEAIKRLITARDLVDKGKAATLERALDAIAAVGTNPEDVLARSISADPMEQLLIEVRGMAQALHRQSDVLHALQEELVELKAENAALRDEVKALPAPHAVAGTEQDRKIAELEKRNQALRVALEAKEREEQERQRPWWRLWQKKKPTLGGG